MTTHEEELEAVAALPTQSRRARNAWYLYDLSNTLFSFVVISFFFGPWVVGPLGAPDSAVMIPFAISMAVSILLAPVFGAVSDRMGRKRFLIATTLLAVSATMLLGLGTFLGLGTNATLWLALLFFAFGNLGFQLGVVFYDAFLPSVSTTANIGRVSGWGTGFGYIGSFVGLGLGILILDQLGLGHPVLFVAAGLTFLLLAVPSFFLLADEIQQPMGLLRGTFMESARNVARTVRTLPQYPGLGRFLLVRVLYADAINTLVLILGIYAVHEIGFQDDSPEYFILLGLGILFAVLSAPFWGRIVDAIGSRHTLVLALLGWSLTLILAIIHPILDLPLAVFYLIGAMVGIFLSGTWTSDRPLLVGLAPAGRVGEWFGLYAMAGRFAAITGPLSYALFVDVIFREHPNARQFGLLTILATFLLALFFIQRLQDPRFVRENPLRRHMPWTDGTGHAWPGWSRIALHAPFIPIYLVLSWILFLPFAEPYQGVYILSQEARDRGFLYHIPDLTEAPWRAVAAIATAPFLNHDSVQLVYVTVLLIIFGIVFEVREGWRRTILVFLGTSAAGALVAGILLHLIYPGLSDSEFFGRAWDQTWSGGSAGAFGLMGALAARARRPWLLLGFFVFWELNVGWWYLRSYTPAFHLTALATGFILTRWVLKPVTRQEAEDPPVAAPEGAP